MSFSLPTYNAKYTTGTFSDLLHGRRALSFDIARSLHKVLGVPADIVLA